MSKGYPKEFRDDVVRVAQSRGPGVGGVASDETIHGRITPWYRGGIRLTPCAHSSGTIMRRRSSIPVTKHMNWSQNDSCGTLRSWQSMVSRSEQGQRCVYRARSH